MALVWLAILLSPLGLVCTAIGAILWLCEQSWGKPGGSMGSRRFLSIGVLLCLPLIVLLMGWAFSLRH